MNQRLVCDCLNVYENKIIESYKKNNGDIELIKEDTQATLACTRCLEDDCSKIDISFPALIKEIKEKGI